MKRDIDVVIGVSLVAIVVAGFVFLPGLRGSSTQSMNAPEQQVATGTVPFIKLAKGMQTAVTRRVNYDITSADQLAELWKLIGAEGTPPSIDFSTQIVIAVFAGTTTSSGISVAKIEDTSERMVLVTIQETETACKKQQAALPYELVAAPITSLPFAHQDNLTTVGCSN